MLSGTGLCDELVTRPEESYRLWCVVVCDLESLKNEEVMTRVGSQRHKKKLIILTRCIRKVWAMRTLNFPYRSQMATKRKPNVVLERNFYCQMFSTNARTHGARFEVLTEVLLQNEVF